MWRGGLVELTSVTVRSSVSTPPPGKLMPYSSEAERAYIP